VIEVMLLEVMLLEVIEELESSTVLSVLAVVKVLEQCIVYPSLCLIFFLISLMPFEG
jgi:hypothetical protein